MKSKTSRLSKDEIKVILRAADEIIAQGGVAAKRKTNYLIFSK